MKLSDKVTSLDLSRKLWEEGLTTPNMECEFWWGTSPIDGKTPIIYYRYGCGLCSKVAKELCPAPLFIEMIGEVKERYSGSLDCNSLAQYLLDTNTKLE